MKFIAIIFLISLFQFAYSAQIFNYPEDHSVHEKFSTEWWYYTGHLENAHNRKFGYELTFFRVQPKSLKTKPILFAHFAITDIEKEKFYHEERMYRPLGKISGYKKRDFSIWLTDWTLKIIKNKHFLYAKNKEIELSLELTESKKPIANGFNGKSYKSDHNQDFSYYYSITKLKSIGKIKINQETFNVEGSSWMDHEWMSLERRNITLTSWDWFSIQLDNNTEIMFYIIKNKDGTIQKVSSGSVHFPDGKVEYLKLDDVDIEVLKTWMSPVTNKSYPSKWKLKIAKYNCELTLIPYINNQELYNNKFSGITYWEGAVKVSGKFKSSLVKGNAYIELTGY